MGLLMLLVAVCDDLPNDRLYIKSLINDFCNRMNYEIRISDFENGEALENYYLNQETLFDIIFLDIYMNGKNGILTAKQIRKYDLDCKIIFTTSSTNHALESFEVFPFNYLTKPLSKSTFFPVFEKAIDASQKEKQKSLSIKVGSSIQKLFLKDILFIESTARTLSIHTIHVKVYSIVLKLDEIQKQIDDPRFIRCHQSYLVNMDYISCVENYSFKLINNREIAIVQRNFAGIKKIFYDYLVNKANMKHSFKKEGE
jgi:DNA-binding LytR/AlgR family response regulator